MVKQRLQLLWSVNTVLSSSVEMNGTGKSCFDTGWSVSLIKRALWSLKHCTDSNDRWFMALICPPQWKPIHILLTELTWRYQEEWLGGNYHGFQWWMGCLSRSMDSQWIKVKMLLVRRDIRLWTAVAWQCDVMTVVLTVRSRELITLACIM